MLHEQGLTEAGLTHYRVLCKRQRRKDPVAPPPEHGHTTETPAGRRLSRKRSLTAASAPRLPAAGRPSPQVSPSNEGQPDEGGGEISDSGDAQRETVISSDRFYVVILSGGWCHARRVT
ncbi:MAG: hypothetical protein ACREX8_15205 [Gammaproteobacteria bacterium]